LAFVVGKQQGFWGGTATEGKSRKRNSSDSKSQNNEGEIHAKHLDKEIVWCGSDVDTVKRIDVAGLGRGAN
jgi:hypothetical protein